MTRRVPTSDHGAREYERLTRRIVYMTYGPGSLRSDQRGTDVEVAHRAEVERLRKRRRALGDAL